jgi:hypothetical protein
MLVFEASRAARSKTKWNLEVHSSRVTSAAQRERIHQKDGDRLSQTQYTDISFIYCTCAMNGNGAKGLMRREEMLLASPAADAAGVVCIL